MGILDIVLDRSPHLDLPGADVSIYTDINDVPTSNSPESDRDNSVLAPDGKPLPEDTLQTAEALAGATTRLVPFVRTLKVGMVGKDVVAVKRALYRAHFRRLTVQTRAFGPILREDLKRFQSHHGLTADGVYGPLTHKKLAPFFDDYGIWLLHQVHIAKAPTTRDKIVATAILGYNKRWLIHYTEGPSRMYGVRNHVLPPNVPSYEDCSSFATWCYWVAGAPDPNGLGYNGYGYTGTMADHGYRVSTAQPGDLILYGYYFPYSHVAIAISSTRAVSNGSEVDPSIVDIHYRQDFNQIRSYL